MKDAWAQLDDLLKQYTKRWEVRPDLAVLAHATKYCVELRMGEPRNNDHDDPLSKIGRYRWHVTNRNVGTMKELAQALLKACEFVEESNQKWAGRA